jgi:hypothetical protein
LQIAVLSPLAFGTWEHMFALAKRWAFSIFSPGVVRKVEGGWTKSEGKEIRRKGKKKVIYNMHTVHLLLNFISLLLVTQM